MLKASNKTKSNSLQMYRRELVHKKVNLLNSLGFNFKELEGADRNSTDDLTVALQAEMLHAGMDRVLYGQIRDIDAALSRLKLGEYGICAQCESRISAKRLKAIPWAAYCVDCQDKIFVGQHAEGSGSPEASIVA